MALRRMCSLIVARATRRNPRRLGAIPALWLTLALAVILAATLVLAPCPPFIPRGDWTGMRMVEAAPTVETFTTSGSWVCPAGVSAVQVESWGGGAAGKNPVANDLDQSLVNSGTSDAVTRAGERYVNWPASVITHVELYLLRAGNPTGTATVTIYAANGSSVLGTLSPTIDVSTISTAWTWYSFDGCVTVPSQQNIYITITFTYTFSNGSNRVRIGSQSGNPYAGGTHFVGLPWTEFTDYDATWRNLTWHTAGGNGGGGGAYSIETSYVVTPGNSYSYTVGTGGATDGASGGDSYWVNTSTVLAKGGTNVTGGAAASGVGDTKYSGGNGATIAAGTVNGGGGGSSAGTGAKGNNGSGATAGAAPTGGGAGGNGGATACLDGTAAAAVGGGGGGAAAGTGTFGAGYAGQIRITYTVPTISITTTSPLASGSVGAAYSQTLTATGGSPAYTWSIASGSLPAGLSLNASTGAITGTPTAAGGPTSVTFRVTDSAAATTTKALSITIGKGTPTITWEDPADIAYGAVLSSTQLDATASVAGTFVYTPASGTLLYAGSGHALHVDFTPSDTTNYNTASADAAITVDPLTVTVTADAQSKVYGSGDPALTYTYSPALVGTDSFSGSLTRAPGENAGSYAITQGTLALSSNYNIAFVSASLTINPKPLTITADDRAKTQGYSITFAGTEFAAVGLVNSDSVTSVTLTSAGADASAPNGDYPITASAAVGTGLGNYSITYFDGILTVSTYGLTISATHLYKTYGDTVTFTGTEFTVIGLMAGDTVDNVTLSSTGAAAAAAAGSHPIVPSAATGTGLGKYTVIYVSSTMTVAPKALTITANDVPKIYGNTVTFAGTEFVAAGLVNSDTVDNVGLISLGAYASIPIGDYAIVPFAASGTGLANYNIAYYLGTLTVSPRDLIVTATGVNKVYDGTTTAAVNLSTDAVAGDTVIAGHVSATFADKNAGTGKTISITGISISGTDAPNYNLLNSTASTTADITQRDLTVIASSASKIYDGTTTAAVTLATNEVGGDNVTAAYISAAFADKNAGSGKTVTVAGISVSGADAANYNLTSTTASTTASIAQRDLIVSAAGVDRVYDGTTMAVVTLATDALGSDTVTASYAAATFADKNAGTGKAASVTGISIGGADAANYHLSSTTASATASITPRNLTVTPTGIDRVYDGTVMTAVGLSNDALGGDLVTVSYVSASFTDKNVGAGKAVSITGISISGADAANYQLLGTTASATASITAATLTITANDIGKTYGETLTFAGTEFTAAGLKTGDFVTIVTLTSAGAGAPASIGSYGIVPSDALGSGLANYSTTYVNGTVTVRAKALTITANSGSKTYGDTVTFAGTEFTAVGLRAGDSVDSVTMNSPGSGAAAATGSYSILPGAALGSGLGNYTIIYVDGTLTVTKATVDWHVTSSPAQSVKGRSVTLTAVVNHTDATGTVTFMDGSVVLGTGTLSDGVATYSTSALSIGDHNITASYDGDGNFYGSTTPAHVHTVDSGPIALWWLIAIVTAVFLVFFGPFVPLLLLRRRRRKQEAEEQAQ